MNRALLGRALALMVMPVALPVALAVAAPFCTVIQSGRAFSQRTARIGRGEVIRFTNADEFLHHVYVESPSFSFASDEQEPGQATDVRFPVPGTFNVMCRIHPKMRLEVTVE